MTMSDRAGRVASDEMARAVAAMRRVVDGEAPARPDPGGWSRERVGLAVGVVALVAVAAGVVLFVARFAGWVAGAGAGLMVLGVIGLVVAWQLATDVDAD